MKIYFRTATHLLQVMRKVFNIKSFFNSNSSILLWEILSLLGSLSIKVEIASVSCLSLVSLLISNADFGAF